jgi:hypothetical protein
MKTKMKFNDAHRGNSILSPTEEFAAMCPIAMMKAILHNTKTNNRHGVKICKNAPYN